MEGMPVANGMTILDPRIDVGQVFRFGLLWIQCMMFGTILSQHEKSDVMDTLTEDFSRGELETKLEVCIMNMSKEYKAFRI